MKGVSCGRGRVYVTGFVCVSRSHIRLSDPSQTVSQLTPIGAAGVLFGFHHESEPKAKGEKWFWKKKQTKDLYVAKETC